MQGVRHGWNVFLPDFLPLPFRVFLLSMYIPSWPRFIHLLMAASSKMTHRVIKQRSMNLTLRLLFFGGLPSHQIWIQWHIFSMWYNRRFTAWMRSNQICRNCNERNFYNILWNPPGTGQSYRRHRLRGHWLTGNFTLPLTGGAGVDACLGCHIVYDQRWIHPIKNWGCLKS